MDFDSTKRIGYFYNPDVSKYSYGNNHVMDPKRISMAHSLIEGYGVYKYLDHYETRESSKEEMAQFHCQDYLDYLENYVSSDKVKLFKYLGLPTIEVNEKEKQKDENKINFGVDLQDDCPGFEGLWTFSQLSSGGSIDAAHLVINNMADLAINWGGGLHHAKKREAYGFCYVNDIVLCIVELLKVYPRVLYIDIDVHHGDGVEEAFFLSNRVMTASFHEFGNDFFPGTGGLNSVGEQDGLYHSINVPIQPGITDDMYREMFKTVINGIMESFKPDAIVLQTGADSIAYDRIGHFNMSTKGHGQCVKFIADLGIPTVVLGGGGYTINNVSRCWAYETGLLVGQQIEGKIPYDDKYYHLYPTSSYLHFPIIPNYENMNKPKEMEKLTTTILQYLKEIESRPGFQFHNVPEGFVYDSDQEIDEEDEQNEAIQISKQNEKDQFQLQEKIQFDTVFKNLIDEQSKIQSRSLQQITSRGQLVNEY